MHVLFDGDVPVHYGFIRLQHEDAELLADLLGAVRGQANGLCGAAVPGRLHLFTALHTGGVPLRVELHETAPTVDPDWEEVVEVTLITEPGPYWLSAFDWWQKIDTPSAGTYRVRWSAIGMDHAHDRTRMPGEPAHDRYLLQLWPAPAAPDVVIRQHARVAQQHHRSATQPPSR